MAALTACHHTEGTYQDRDKWMLPDDGMTRMTLRGRPRQVTEYGYRVADSARPERRRSFYSRFGFNAQGNLISLYEYMDDTLWLTFDYWVDENGLQDSTRGIKDGRVIHMVSRRLTDGRYLTISPHVTSKPTASIISFPSNGDEKIQEYYADSTAKGKPEQSAHFYYAGNRLMRVEAQTKEGPEEVKYFYSRFDAPDSSWTYKNNVIGRTLAERQLYLNNSHGDAVREITIRGNDTTFLEDHTYTCDAKGNWVRQISITRKQSTPTYSAGGPYIREREFVY